MQRRKDLEEAAIRAQEATSPWRRYAILATGWMFVVLGVLGLFLPFLQGILFLVVGLIVLSSQSPWAARRLQRFLDTYPAADRLHSQAEGTVRRLHARRRLLRQRWRQRHHHRRHHRST